MAFNSMGVKAVSMLSVLLLACMWQSSAKNINKKERALLDSYALLENTTVLESGLMYQIMKNGTGLYTPMGESKITVNFHGVNPMNGEVYGSTYFKGELSEVYIKDVLKGWAEALRMMVEGDKWFLIIPSELAYGEEGKYPSVGPDEPLTVEIEIIKIHDWRVPVSQCNIKTRENCSDKENKFMDKFMVMGGKQLNTEAAIKELTRLESAFQPGMKPEVGDWMEERIRLLKELTQEEEEDDREFTPLGKAKLEEKKDVKKDEL